MKNFIPVAFTEEEEVACPVCVVRLELEDRLEKEFLAFRELFARVLSEKSLDRDVADKLFKTYELFNTYFGDYRVSFTVNLCIWFSAERFGNASKIPDVLAAYEEYRDKTKSAFAEFEEALSDTLSALEGAGVDVAELREAHDEVVTASAGFWVEVDKWTDERKSSSFKIL